MMSIETIAAQITPPGKGGVGVIRISGPQVVKVAQIILGHLPQPRHAEYLPFVDEHGKTLDQGIAIYFPAPNSFTGEDVLELQGHGGPVVLDLLLKQIISVANVRIAKPGEFSERAFLNDKIDLAQAEAIADLIDASSEQAARSAVLALQGVFSQYINQLVESLTQLRVYIEAAMDFPDEEIDFLSDGKVEEQLTQLITSLNQITKQARQGCLLREGMKVVIAGRPNAGKSSLLNALAGRDTAIVSQIAGTTRDVLREYIHLDGMPLHIIDTAGLRNAQDEIEQIGIERAWQEIEQADHILLMVDATSADEMAEQQQLWTELMKRLPTTLPLTVIRNKVDLTGEKVRLEKVSDHSQINLSAKTGDGVDILREYLKQTMGYNQQTEGTFLARRRHLQALELAHQHISQGLELLVNTHSSELLAEELRLAQQSLAEITGEVTSDDLLGRIFSSFCIGK